MASNVSIGGVPHDGFSIGAIGGPFTENEVLFGKADGTIDQSPNFQFRDSYLFLQDSRTNVGIGTNVFGAITTSDDSIAIGNGAGSGIISGNDNIAIGNNTMGSFSAVTGRDNTVIGRNAGRSLSSAWQAIHIGVGAGGGVTTQSNNIAIGAYAGDATYGSGSSVVALGYYAGRNAGNFTISIGRDACAVGVGAERSVFIGHGAGQRVTGDNNICIGEYAGDNVNAVSFSYSIFIGRSAGDKNNTGIRNIGIGQNAMGNGANIFSGNNNLAIGYNAMNTLSTGYDNVAIGQDAMEDMTTGFRNIAIGEKALANSETGDRNVAIGDGALERIGIGFRANVAIGAQAGYSLDGDDNVIIGIGAGSGALVGDGNVLIGRNAGTSLTSATKNVVIGYYATLPAVTDDGMLVIANSNTSRSLVRGDFGNNYFTIHGETRLSHATVGGDGHVTRHCITDTISPSIDADSAITIPAGANIIGVSFWVTLAVETSGATNTWAADFITGSTTALVTAGTSGAFGTKVDTMVPSEITSAGTKIRLDAPGAETFTAGLVQIQVYYETLTSMD